MSKTTMLSFLVVLFLGAGDLTNAQDISIPPTQIDINRSDNGRNNSQATPRVSRQQAGEIAKQRFAGNILRISLVGEGSNQRYQIRMENEGKVFTVFVNVATGRISGGG